MMLNICRTISALTQAIREYSEQRKHEFEWFKSYYRFATKQDLKEMENKIMAAFDDIKAELGVINGTTNEIATDIDELIVKLGQPGGLTEAQAQEIVADLQGHSTKLKGVAAKYPVPVPPA